MLANRRKTSPDINPITKTAPITVITIRYVGKTVSDDTVRQFSEIVIEANMTIIIMSMLFSHKNECYAAG